jgi:hypothetical protein
MKRLLFLLSFLFLASTAFAGVTYDFQIVTDGPGGGTLAGKAALSGSSMRMDIDRGDNLLFKNGSIVLSKDGGETLLILDPKQKTYTEFSVEQVFAALGSMSKMTAGLVKFSISNPNVQVTDGGAGGTIEGYATRKYIIDTSYDMEVSVLRMKNRSSIHSITESYVTPKLGDVKPSFIQQKNFRTGIEELDGLVKAHADAVRNGFALKNVTTTTTTDKGGKKSVSTSTMTLSNLKEAAVQASHFAIPSGYTETENAGFMIPRP